MKHVFFGETVRGNACMNLARELEDSVEFLRKYKVTLYVYSEIYHSLRDLWRHGKTTTISEQAAGIYRKLGFTVAADGIGWVIS